jgi:hypothetical protein
VGVQNNAETLRKLVQDKTRTEKDKGRERRHLQAKVTHDTPPTVTDPGVVFGDIQSLLDTAFIDEDVARAARLESIKSPKNETIESTETRLEGLLAKMGSDLELASLTDRLTKSAETLISLQRQVASTKHELTTPNKSQDESPIQPHSQSLPTDSEPENIVPTEITTSSSSPPLSSLSDSLSTTLPEKTNEVISPETVPNTTSSEVSAEAVMKHVANESPAKPTTRKRTSSAPNRNITETISPETAPETVPEILTKAVTNNVANESPAKPFADERNSSAPNPTEPSPSSSSLSDSLSTTLPENNNETISPETVVEPVPNNASSEISVEAVTNKVVSENPAIPLNDERTSSAANPTEPSSTSPKQ